MKDMTMDKYYDFLDEWVGINADALDLAFGLNGYNEETAKNILSWATGYDDFEQYCEEEFPDVNWDGYWIKKK